MASPPPQRIRFALYGAAAAITVYAGLRIWSASLAPEASLQVRADAKPRPAATAQAPVSPLLQAYLDMPEEIDRLPFLATVGLVGPHRGEMIELLQAALFDESDRCRDQAVLWIATFELTELLPDLVRSVLERVPARPYGPARPAHYHPGAAGLAVLARFGPTAAPAAKDALLALQEREGAWVFPWIEHPLLEMAPGDPQVLAAAEAAAASTDPFVAATGRRALRHTPADPASR